MTDIRRWPVVEDPDLGPFSAFGSDSNPLAERFGGDYRSPSAVAALAERISIPGDVRQRLCAALRRFHADCSGDPESASNISALEDPRTLVVATGQQPGLFGGPLYTVYKALSAVSVARLWSRRLQRRVVPVFWIASDDHDIHEVDSAVLLNGNSELVRLKADLGPFGPPIADLLVSDPHLTLARTLAATCFGSDFDDSAHSAWFPKLGETWPRWFARTLLAMTRGTGLILAEPHSLRDLIAPLLDREFGEPRRSPAALARGAEALRRIGTSPAFDEALPSCLFVTIDGKRLRVDGSKHSRDDVTRARAASRSGLSADAALRTVVQSTILPVLGVVGGPGEYRYWSQLRELFETHRIEMPLFVPRFRATLLWPAIRKQISALELPESEWLVAEADALAKMRAVETPGQATWNDRKTDVRVAFERLAETLVPLGGSVPARVEQARAGLEQSLARLLEVAAARERESSGSSEKRRRTVATALRPQGKAQERVLAALPLALRFGFDWFPKLAESLDIEEVRASYVELTY